MVSSLPKLDVIHDGVAAAAAGAAAVEAVAGFAGVAVGVAGEDTAA